MWARQVRPGQALRKGPTRAQLLPAPCLLPLPLHQACLTCTATLGVRTPREQPPTNPPRHLRPTTSRWTPSRRARWRRICTPSYQARGDNHGAWHKPNTGTATQRGGRLAAPSARSIRTNRQPHTPNMGTQKHTPQHTHTDMCTHAHTNEQAGRWTKAQCQSRAGGSSLTPKRQRLPPCSDATYCGAPGQRGACANGARARLLCRALRHKCTLSGAVHM
jgi:hypothetical protein